MQIGDHVAGGLPHVHVGDDSSGLHIVVRAVVVAPHEHQLRLSIGCRIRHFHTDMQNVTLCKVNFVIIIWNRRLAQIVVEIHRIRLGRVVGIRDNTLRGEIFHRGGREEDLQKVFGAVALDTAAAKEVELNIHRRYIAHIKYFGGNHCCVIVVQPVTRRRAVLRDKERIGYRRDAIRHHGRSYRPVVEAGAVVELPIPVSCVGEVCEIGQGCGSTLGGEIAGDPHQRVTDGRNLHLIVRERGNRRDHCIAANIINIVPVCIGRGSVADKTTGRIVAHPVDEGRVAALSRKGHIRNNLAIRAVIDVDVIQGDAGKLLVLIPDGEKSKLQGGRI